MKQLSASDASLLYMESSKAPMHIATLAIYDPSTAPGGKVRFKEIIQNYARRIRGIASMTQHVVEVPMQLDNPYWVDDGTFDPEFHIRHIALPKPGDWRQFCIQIARLHARPLDLSRPLWELWVIEGLDNLEGIPKGSFALLNKTHHAAIDGTSGMELTEAVHDFTPDYDTSERRSGAVKIDSNPSKTELLIRSSINAMKKPREFFSFAREALPKVARTVADVRSGKLQRVTDVPRTRFNDPISPYRVYDATTFPFADIKRIKKSVEGATVNDVALAIVGGALNKYLSAHEDLPEIPMVAAVPINIRTDNDETGGNLVANMMVALATDVADPLQRLQTIHENTVQGKELTTSIGARTINDFSEFLPTALMSQAMQVPNRLGLGNRSKPVINTAITNIPGPQIPLYNTGAKMLRCFGVSPLRDTLGLFHVVGSYCEDFCFSFTACREIMPDPDFYMQCIQEAYQEMLETVE